MEVPKEILFKYMKEMMLVGPEIRYDTSDHAELERHLEYWNGNSFPLATYVGVFREYIDQGEPPHHIANPEWKEMTEDLILRNRALIEEDKHLEGEEAEIFQL